MRDRLIELLKQVNFDFGEECVACCEDGYKCTPMLEDFFADHLLANGVIVPPCKIGDKLYDATEFFSDTYAPEIYELQDNVMTIEKGRNGEYLFTYDGMYVYPEEIGKTVFLTREEAEAKLKGEQE